MLSQTYIVDDRREQPQSVPLEEKPNFGDSSGTFFSMYSRIAEEEDARMAERWKKDADGILVFVSSHIIIHITTCLDWNFVVRFILCCCRRIACCVCPGPEAEPSGHLRILSREHLSGPRRRQSIAGVRPVCYCQAASVLSFESRRLGQFTLVSELSYQSYLRTVGNIAASMGSSISQSYSAYTMQSREASANACVFCRRCRQDACPLGS